MRIQFTFLLLLILPNLYAQDKGSPLQIEGTPVSLETDALERTFSNYEVFRLDISPMVVNRETKGGLHVALQLGNAHNWNVQLHPAPLFKPGFKYKVLTERGITYQAPPQNAIFKGRFTSQDAGMVRMSIHESYIRGVLKSRDAEYYIEPLSVFLKGANPAHYVVYQASDVLKDPELHCGMSEAREHAPKKETPTDSPTRMMDPCVKEVELALAGAFDMVTKFGSVNAVQNHILDITNIMEGLYTPFNIDYVIVDMVIPASSGADPWSGSAFMDILLPDFATWGNTAGNFATHDIGQLWVARNVFRGSEAEPEFGLIGRADGLGVVCTGDRYNVCEDFNPALSCLSSLSAHEIGHLWNGLHSLATENVTIMSAFIVCAATEFTADNTNNIQSHIDSRGCLSDCVVPDNDLCANAIPVECGRNYSGNTINATENDAPMACTGGGTPNEGVWYRFSGNGQIVTVSTAGSAFDTQINIYSGNCGALVCEAGDDDGGSGSTSEATFCTAAGTDYWIYVDGFGGDEGYFLLTVTCEDDITPPSISCPSNLVLSNDTGDCGAIVNYAAATASDFCGIASVTYSQTSGTFFPVGTTTVTATATDNSNLKSDCSFTITVNDTEDPVALCQDVEVYLNSDGEGSITTAQVNDGSSDNCGLKSISLDKVDFDCDDLDENTVTLTIIDFFDNTDQCEATITVIDDIPPVAVCLNSTVEIQWDGFYTLQESDVFDALNSFDNCFITEVDFPATVFDCDDKFMTFEFPVTISDQSGNTDGCTASVYVDVSNALPPQWSTGSIGNSGNTYAFDPCSKPAPEDGDYTLTSTGRTTPDNNFDNMGYMYQPLCGNSGMQFKVEDVDNGYVGLMMRESGNPGSKMAGVFSNLTSLLRWHTRYQTGGNANSILLYKPFPYWLRLVRQGNWIRGYFSQYGTNWQLIHQVYLPMNNCIGVGVAVYTTDPNGTAEAVVSHVSTVTNPIFLNGGHTPQGISMEDPEGQLSMQAYPNPASEELFIELETREDLPVTYQLYNALGQAMQTQEQESSKTTARWDISQLRPGTYLIEARLENGQRQVIRFVKANRP